MVPGTLKVPPWSSQSAPREPKWAPWGPKRVPWDPQSDSLKLKRDPLRPRRRLAELPVLLSVAQSAPNTAPAVQLGHPVAYFDEILPTMTGGVPPPNCPSDSPGGPSDTKPYDQTRRWFGELSYKGGNL